MSQFEPFANDSQSQSVGDLTIENGTDKVSLYGSLNLTRDKAGLKQARALKAILDVAVRVLEQHSDLPDKLAAAEPTVAVKNPFA
jgi:hypothetical protein